MSADRYLGNKEEMTIFKVTALSGLGYFNLDVQFN